MFSISRALSFIIFALFLCATSFVECQVPAPVVSKGADAPVLAPVSIPIALAQKDPNKKKKEKDTDDETDDDTDDDDGTSNCGVICTLCNVSPFLQQNFGWLCTLFGA